MNKLYTQVSLFFFTLLLILILQCGGGNSKTGSESLPAEKTISQTVALPIDTNITYLSQLLAGIRPKPGIIQKDWNQDSLDEFARQSTLKYENMCKTRLSAIQDWNKKNLATAELTDTSFAFYPFSGGDFIHLHWLLPNANDYFMVAKEQVGSLPDVNQMDNKSVLRYLNGIDVVLRDIYSKSYFITKNMISDIHGAKLIDGMLPLIVWASARMNYDIVSLQYFDVDSLGNTVDKEQHKSMGVKLIIKDRASGKLKTLTYLSADISDKGFMDKPGIMKYLEKQIPSQSNSFVKSASYLLHYGSFSQIRNFILMKSRSLVQDDTGIPYKYFDKNIWKVSVFGEYEKPVSDFSENLFQQDLNAAYADSNYFKGKINFSLGYHWGSEKQNQMFIHKKNSVSAKR